MRMRIIRRKSGDCTCSHESSLARLKALLVAIPSAALAVPWYSLHLCHRYTMHAEVDII